MPRIIFRSHPVPPDVAPVGQSGYSAERIHNSSSQTPLQEVAIPHSPRALRPFRGVNFHVSVLAVFLVTFRDDVAGS